MAFIYLAGWCLIRVVRNFTYNYFGIRNSSYTAVITLTTVLQGEIATAGISKTLVYLVVTVVVFVVALFSRWSWANAQPSVLTSARPRALTSALNSWGFVIAFL